VLRPSRQFTRQDIGRIAERAATEFRNRSMNQISCFGPLEGEFGLYSTLSNFVRTKNPLSAEISEAVQDGDEVALLQVLIKAMEVAFATLYEKGALARLQIVEALPAEAISEWLSMSQRVGSTSSASVTPSVSEPEAPAPIVLTPLEKVVLDFRGDRENGIPPMASDVFRRTWINDRRRRPVYDAAVEQGLV
jgi:hypothetical protein